MKLDSPAGQLYEQIVQIPLIDPHTHIDPHRPAARGLDDILGYHYYTELAHSAGMSKAPLDAGVPPRERVAAILAHMDRYDNTAQYQWFLEIARAFLGFQGDRVTANDATWLCDQADRLMAQPDWEQQVLRRSNLQQIFLTNEFDDPLEWKEGSLGADRGRIEDSRTSSTTPSLVSSPTAAPRTPHDPAVYVPCLRTDDLVFKLDQPAVRQRLARATKIEAGDPASLRKAVTALFDHFTKHNARACAISLPPDFTPLPVSETDLAAALRNQGPDPGVARARGVFWMLAEHCREYRLPFDLMIGVNRRVYRDGVYQGQDLFDGRLSLIQYAELFNAFPTVPFCISVLSSGLNQELVSYSWIFPNVLTSGHWWYSNIPVYIEQDLRGRLQAVPKTKQIGYYSDMYKLEFALPKYNMYRRILAKVLADDFVRPGVLTEQGAIDVARRLLHDNVKAIFNV